MLFQEPYLCLLLVGGRNGGEHSHLKGLRITGLIFITRTEHLPAPSANTQISSLSNQDSEDITTHSLRLNIHRSPELEPRLLSGKLLYPSPRLDVRWKQIFSCQHPNNLSPGSTPQDDQMPKAQRREEQVRIGNWAIFA
jgi:hypothetical protein